MIRMTRKQELDNADREIAAGLHQFPKGSFIRALITDVYTPFVHHVIEMKHNGLDGLPTALSPEAVKAECTLVVSNMIIELVRHTVPAEELGDQFAACQQMLAMIASNLTEDLNHRAQDRVQQAVQLKRPN